MIKEGQSIRLSVPAKAEYALVIRTALGGVGVIADLDIDRMDDLLAASDECVDLLIHQPREGKTLEMTCLEEEKGLKVCFEIVWGEGTRENPGADMQMSRAVLNTLIADVRLESDEYGVKGITLLQSPCRI